MGVWPKGYAWPLLSPWRTNTGLVPQLSCPVTHVATTWCAPPPSLLASRLSPAATPTWSLTAGRAGGAGQQPRRVQGFRPPKPHWQGGVVAGRNGARRTGTARAAPLIAISRVRSCAVLGVRLPSAVHVASSHPMCTWVKWVWHLGCSTPLTRPPFRLLASCPLPHTAPTTHPTPPTPPFRCQDIPCQPRLGQALPAGRATQPLQSRHLLRRRPGGE